MILSRSVVYNTGLDEKLLCPSKLLTLEMGIVLAKYRQRGDANETDLMRAWPMMFFHDPNISGGSASCLGRDAA